MSQIETFEYPSAGGAQASPEWNGYEAPDRKSKPEAGTEDGCAGQVNWEKRLTEEAGKAFEAGHKRGLEEAREAEREAIANAKRQMDRRLAGAVESLAEARERYLASIESEVVKLALAVAARILRRESQMDPLLLTGAVRVALGQLSNTTEVRLRVPADDLDLWREAMALIPNLAARPEVLAGEGMRLGECIVESKVGSVDLGIRSQLGEIERGFFDRGAGVPGMRSKAGRELPPLEDGFR